MDSNSIPKFKDRKSLGVKKFSRTTHKIFCHLHYHGLCMTNDSKFNLCSSFPQTIKGAIFVLFSEETKDLELTFISKCISAVEKRG